MMSVSGKTTARAAGCRHLACAPALRPAPVRRPRISVQAAGASGNGNGNGNAAGKIGFIGLGKMGSNMVTKLVEAGHRLVVCDTNTYAVERAVQLDKDRVHTARSPAELAATDGVDIIFTSLPHSRVADVYMGKEGLLHAHEGSMASLLVDCSTTEPALIRKIAVAASRTKLSPRRRAQSRPQFASLGDIDYPIVIDAPVSGGVVGAEKGTLEFMVGGDKDALEIARPYLMNMGGSVTHCGALGAGVAARLCNTLIVSAVMAATSEGLALARRLGVEPEVMTEVLNRGSGQSWVSSHYNPVPGITPGIPAGAGYVGGFSTDTVLDQLDMVLKASDEVYSPSPIANLLASELYKKIQTDNLGDFDFTSIYRYYYGSGTTSDRWKGGDRLFNSMPM